MPYDKNRNAVSITLEYAYDDWTIFQIAERLGKKEIAETYKKRALSYRNVFDANEGFARAKLSDGNWKKDFNVLETHGDGILSGLSRHERICA